MRYKISVETVKGIEINFIVEHYEIDNSLVCFKDQKTGLEKKFPVHRCDIEEVN